MAAHLVHVGAECALRAEVKVGHAESVASKAREEAEHKVHIRPAWNAVGCVRRSAQAGQPQWQHMWRAAHPLSPSPALQRSSQSPSSTEYADTASCLLRLAPAAAGGDHTPWSVLALGQVRIKGRPLCAVGAPSPESPAEQSLLPPSSSALSSSRPMLCPMPAPPNIVAGYTSLGKAGTRGCWRVLLRCFSTKAHPRAWLPSSIALAKDL